MDKIGTALVEGYSDHGFCIDISEARNIGLTIEELEGEQLDLVWDLFKLNKQKGELDREEKEKEMMDAIKNLPPEIMKLIPRSSPDRDGKHLGRPDPFARQGNVMHVNRHARPTESIDKIALATGVAAELMRRKGEITLDHIRAIPFLTTRAEVDAVVDRILAQFDAEIEQRMVESAPILRRERVIRLKKSHSAR